MNVKKITLLMLSAVMAFSFTGCSKKDSGEEQKKFDEFMKQEFVESMEQSYPNTHIILENPKNYGVDTSKTKIQIDKEMTEATFKENKELTDKSEKAFEEFDRDALTDEQKDIVDRAMEEATKFQLEQSAKDEEEGIKVMEDYGCKVNTLTDEQKMEFQKIMENADVFGVAKDSMENPKFFDGMLKDLEEYRMKGEK